MPQRAARLAAVLCAASIVAGCANENSIFRENRLSTTRPTVITMDAKQRNVMIVPEMEQGRANQWRVCAEASPDVFSALSTSAGADLGFGQSGGQTDARAQAAIAIAEAAGTIERTQTINMLRESMYRTCERYLSGAIDQATFVVQAGRDWRAMIAILAIEQLTRMARPPSTIISAGSTSATVENAGDILRRVAAAEDAQTAAQSQLETAQATQTANCAGDSATPACTAATQGVTNAQARLTAAKESVTSWRQIAQNPPAPNRSEAETGAGTNDSGEQTTQPASPSNRVADVVNDIVRRAFDTDETQLFCLQVLSPQSAYEGIEAIRARCVDYLLARIASERQQLLSDPSLQPLVDEQTASVQTAQSEMIAYLGTLTPQQYDQQVIRLRQTLMGFCAGQPLLGCIGWVASGRLDGFDSSVVRQAIQSARGGG